MGGRRSAVPGVIDTLQAGFDAVNRIPWILLIPVGLDLLLILGPRLSVRAAVEPLLAAYEESVRWYSRQVGAGEPLAGQATQVLTLARAWASEFNLLSLLVAVVAGVPVAGLPGRHLLGEYQLRGLGEVVGLAILCQLVGLWLGCLYFGLLAQQVRDGRVDLTLLLRRRVWLYWVSLLEFIGLFFGGIVAVGLPTSLLVGLVQLLAPAVGAFLSVLLLVLFQVGLLWLLIYLFFLVDAVVISEVGPLQAVANSVRVVGSNFWPALGLIALIFLISTGMHLIWQALARENWGLAIGVVGNAYIASGLAAGSMVFYRTRLIQQTEAPPVTLRGLG